ncbi:MAG: hypothetical protein LBK42_04055 [Propionibacteriaceae bacterium]|jgi:hypothetical protein|nr:hypothetical protein [Propionibacteriaceae bacterium]
MTATAGDAAFRAVATALGLVSAVARESQLVREGVYLAWDDLTRAGLIGDDLAPSAVEYLDDALARIQEARRASWRANGADCDALDALADAEVAVTARATAVRAAWAELDAGAES